MSFRPTHELFRVQTQLTRPSLAPHKLLPWLLFISLTLPAAVSADSLRCPYPLCTSDSCSYAARPDPQTAYTHDTFESGYRPKDFTLFRAGSWYHLIYILQYGDSDTSATRFGHARSKDLNNWSILPSVLPVSSEYWDNLHVWAPSVIARGDTYYLFYTGVSTSGKQSIGLATSTDLADWNRLGAPILTCEAVSWALCDSSSGYGRDFRDPFVMQNPADTSEWLMYYTTRAADSTFVPGLAVSDGDFTLTFPPEADAV